MLKARARSQDDSDVCDFPSCLAECSRRMFDRQDACDVTFVVKGPGDASETKIGAHRFVLCSRSPVFYKTLHWGSKTAPDKKLKENDIPAETFREILRFMYCDELSLTLLNAVQVLQAARKYQINGLTQRCLEFVANNLTDNDVCSLLERAVSISEQPLIDVCLCHIECHTAAVFQSPSFLAVSQTALTHIVSLQTLDVSELDLFHACVAWAEHRATISSPTKVALNGKVLRRHLEPLVPLIRFPTMTTEEFATFVVPLNILTDTETCNVYKYFTCPERPEKWFQTTRRSRPGEYDRSTVEGAAGLYPDIGDVKDNESNNAALTPTAPYHERPPNYEQSA